MSFLWPRVKGIVYQCPSAACEASCDTDAVLTFQEAIASGADLPVHTLLPEFSEAFTPGSVSIVSASAGSGKTTLIPLACADLITSGERVIVCSPRRMSARSCARRLASLLKDRLGNLVGFSVRGQSQRSRETRIEFVTPGVLARMIHSDPGLDGIGCVVLDEFHERAVDSDLSLAFLIDIRSLLREDLRLVVMSATIDDTALGKLLGDLPSRFFELKRELFPVSIRWEAPPRGIEVFQGERISRGFLRHVASLAWDSLETYPGDILVFLPGVWEIERVCEFLDDADAQVIPLHAQLSPARQDEVFSPSNERRIIVSSAIAESALTVPGVQIVIDSTLSRQTRFSPSREASTLVTIPSPRSSMIQRAGRAGRVGPGVCIRAMEESTWSMRPAHPSPEITDCDPLPPLLSVACWSRADFSCLHLLDTPSAGYEAYARTSLQALGAIDEAGLALPHGRELVLAPVDPRIAHALSALQGSIPSGIAAMCAALVSEDLRPQGADLLSAIYSLSPSSPQGKRVEESAARLASGIRPHLDKDTKQALSQALPLFVAFAYPLRIARKRAQSRRYLLASGQGASLPPSSSLEGSEWIAIAELQSEGNADAIIRSALPIDSNDVDLAASHLREKTSQLRIDNGVIIGFEEEKLGAIVLSNTRLPSPDRSEMREVARRNLEEMSVSDLPWDDNAKQLRMRIMACHRLIGDPWPPLDDAHIIPACIDHLSEQWSAGVAFSQLDLSEALNALLPWPLNMDLERVAPQQITIPTGAHRSVKWDEDGAYVRLRVQEAFGWTDTPHFVRGRLPLRVELTDPAGRPVAITSDLASFWEGPYQQVRSQLRGRYSKHHWPEDPFSVAPTSRTKRHSTHS